MPVNVDIGLDAFANEPPVPDKILHKPVPNEAVLAARVTVVNPHVEAPV